MFEKKEAASAHRLIRSNRKVKKILKRIALGMGCLFVVLGIAFAGVSARASGILDARHEVHHMDFTRPTVQDASAISRGEHLVRSRYACATCHGEDLAGGVMIDDPAIGRVLGPNLTRGRGSSTLDYDMADWDRSVRHGVKKDGRPSLMPSEDFFKMSDAELSDIVAYIDSVPPVDAQVPEVELGPIGKVLLVTGKLPISAHKQEAGQVHPTEPPPTSDSVRFGEHLVATCTGCHRANFEGGPIPFGPPDWPEAGNLTLHEQGLGGYTYEDFERALTKGVRKDGRPFQAPMHEVVAVTKNMLPSERSAIWDYLRSLPKVKKGQ